MRRQAAPRVEHFDLFGKSHRHVRYVFVDRALLIVLFIPPECETMRFEIMLGRSPGILAVDSRTEVLPSDVSGHLGRCHP